MKILLVTAPQDKAEEIGRKAVEARRVACANICPGVSSIFRWEGKLDRADEAVILDVETAVYFSLDGAGLRMWELLGDGKSVPEVSREIGVTGTTLHKAIQSGRLHAFKKKR